MTSNIEISRGAASFVSPDRYEDFTSLGEDGPAEAGARRNLSSSHSRKILPNRLIQWQK